MVGRILATLFGLPFVALGIATFVAIIAGVAGDREPAGWPAVEGRVVDSRIARDEDGEQVAAVSYCYEVDGKPRVADTPRLKNLSGDPAAIREIVNRHRPGDRVRVHVDPDDPARAALVWGPVTDYLHALLVLPFVGFGTGVIALAWWAGPKRKPATPAGRRRARLTGARGGALLGLLFFGAFLAVGLLVGGLFFVRPWLDGRAAAAGWDRVPAVVESSRVRSESGGESVTYAVDVIYRYDAGGRAYWGNRYRFAGGSDSFYKPKKAWVDAHPAGTQFEVYVDPDDPAQSVVRRDGGTSMWFGLIPLAFALVGGVGTIGSAYALVAANRATPARRAEVDPVRPWLPATVPLRVPRGERLVTRLTLAGLMNGLGWPLAVFFGRLFEPGDGWVEASFLYVVLPLILLAATWQALRAVHARGCSGCWCRCRR